MSLPRKRLLMVDDDRDLLASYQRAMSLEPDWEFRTAASAAEALKRLEESLPDVIILDYDLGPGEKSGLEFLKELRASPRYGKLAVLLFTGLMIDSVDRAAGLDLGADDYVLKPVSPPVLLAKANAALRRAGGGPA